MIFFFLGDMKVADAKKKFDVGDEIVVSNENIGNSVEDNLELTNVYVHQNHQVNHWASHQLWYGTTLHANIYVSAVAKNNVPRSVCFWTWILISMISFYSFTSFNSNLRVSTQD